MQDHPEATQRATKHPNLARVRAILAKKAKPNILKTPVVLKKIQTSVTDAEKIYESLPLRGIMDMCKDDGLEAFTKLYPDFKKNNPAVVKWMLDGIFDAGVFREYLTRYFTPGERTIKKFMHAQAIYEIGIQKFVAKQRNIRLTRPQMRELEKTAYAAYRDLADKLQEEQDKIKNTQKEASTYAARRLLMAVRNVPVYDDEIFNFE